MITKRLSTGREIHIIDNAFTAMQALSFESYANRCVYRLLGSIDASISRANNEKFFGATLSGEDVNALGIFNTPRFIDISKMFQGMTPMRSWILCTTPSTKYLYHPDHSEDTSITFLYYMNGFWHPEWGGETLFCDEYGEPEITVACKPNRIVIFPSSILHKPSSTSGDSKFRFTFTTTFVKNEYT